jgi:hypothetical protein
MECNSKIQTRIAYKSNSISQYNHFSLRATSKILNLLQCLTNVVTCITCIQHPNAIDISHVVPTFTFILSFVILAFAMMHCSLDMTYRTHSSSERLGLVILKGIDDDICELYDKCEN